VKHLQQRMAEAALIHRTVTQTESESKTEVAESAERLENSLAARRVFQAVIQAIQRTVHGKIADVVSRCLSSVFDEPYEFRINFEQKRGRTEARLVFVRGGMEVDPMMASGGGVVDVASFALRLACLMLTRPVSRKVIVLDEPFKFVSAEYRGRIRRMLLELSEQMGIQFIVVTHVRELECGKIVRVEG